MIPMLNFKLQSVTTTEIILIKKRTLNGEQLKFNLSRRCRKSDGKGNEYIGECSAELLLVDEENIERDDRTFYVKVALNGTFICNESQEDITDEALHSSTMLELLPHVRACLASTMTNAGLTPYIIPNSIIPEFS